MKEVSVNENETDIALLRSKIAYLSGYGCWPPSMGEPDSYRKKLDELVTDLHQTFMEIFPYESGE